MLNCVAFVVHFCALWQQALAAFSAAACQQGAPVLGGHACAESELALAAAFGRLVCSLAHSFYVCIKTSAPDARAHIITYYQDMSSIILTQILPEYEKTQLLSALSRRRSETAYGSCTMNLSSASQVTSPFTKQRPVATPIAPRILVSSVSMMSTSPGSTGRRHFTLSQLMK